MDSDPSDPASVLQLRISLRGVGPPVWRRLLVLGMVGGVTDWSIEDGFADGINCAIIRYQLIL